MFKLMKSMLVLLIPTALAQNDCFRLTNSAACGPFEGMMVQTTGVFSNVTSFDAYITAHFNTNASYISAFKRIFNCPNYDGKGQRYYISHYCGLFVDTAKGVCNSNKTQIQVCPSVSNAAISSVEAIFRNPAICSPEATPARINLLETYNIARNGFDKTAEKCVSGLTTELTQCGFFTLAEALEYCTANANDECCSKLTDSTQPNIVSLEKLKEIPQAEEASTASNSGLIIGACVGGFLGLLLVIFLVLYVFRRRSANKENSAPSLSGEDSVQISETYEVIYNYVPNLSDEIYLYVGDKIIVKCKFDDGWALGYNMSTKQEGSFPMACVSSLSNDKRSTYKYESSAVDRKKQLGFVLLLMLFLHLMKSFGNGESNRLFHNAPINQSHPQWISAAKEKKYFCHRMYPVLKEHIPPYIKLIEKTSYGFPMYVYKNQDIVSDSISNSGSWDKDRSDLMLSELNAFAKANRLEKKDVTLIDIGANVGWFSMTAAYAGFKVISFEPMVSNELILHMNMCLLDSAGESSLWTFINMGLDEKTQSCKMISDSTNVGDGITRCGDFEVSGDYTVKSVTENERLDNLITEKDLDKMNIGLVKMDVESHEKFVILGGQKFFKSPKVNKMLIELLKNENSKWVYEWLVDNGFKMSLKSFMGPLFKFIDKSVDVFVWKG